MSWNRSIYSAVLGTEIFLSSLKVVDLENVLGLDYKRASATCSAQNPAHFYSLGLSPRKVFLGLHYKCSDSPLIYLNGTYEFPSAKEKRMCIIRAVHCSEGV